MTTELEGMSAAAGYENLSAADAAFYAECNDTRSPYDDQQTVVSLFRQQAARTPGHMAVVFKQKQLTYQMLDEVTDRLAAYIHGLGIGRENVVSILISRSAYMPVTALGVSKAGAAYQPLDPSYPPERLAFMMKDASAKLLIADESLLPLLPDYHGPVLLTKDIFALPVGEIPAGPEPQDLFILLYTSGSTGIPKGCMLEHSNLTAFCHDYIHRFALGPDCAVAAYASFGFDANMMDTYPTLLSGAVLHIIPEEMRLELENINAYFNEHHITHSFMTTQVGRQFAVEIHDNHSLHYLLTGGETLVPLTPPDGYEFLNVYGPTECTILSTIFRVDRLYENVPIGRMLDNMRFYILDKDKKSVPVGEEGELYLSGPQISRGYLNRPEKTQEAFLLNPFCEEKPYDRMYYTGDVVRLLPDGNIEFIGRRDAQVKVRGFRIELTEIEQVIRDFPGITDATVIARNAPAGGQMVLAYVVSNEKVDISALHAFIGEQKPPYMVPAATMQIERIPLNPNMKVDKRKLPEIRFDTAEEGTRQLTQLENGLSEIVKNILGQDKFPVSAQLILGGLTSLSAIKLAAAIQKKYGFCPDVKELLQGASILSIEDVMVAHMMQAGKVPMVEKRMLDRYPLTQTQLGIYLECMKEGGSEAYNIPLLVRLPQMVDRLRLKEAVRQVMACHPVFCAAVVTDETGDVYMQPRPGLAWEIEEVSMQEAEMPPELTHFAFDGKPLFHVRLLRTESSAYLLLEVHHILADGESVMVLLPEIDRAYGGEVLEEEAYTAFDLALDEADARRTGELAKAKAYYDSVFQGVSVDSLPAPDVFDRESSLRNLRLPLGLKPESLQELCKQQQITENAFFTGTFGLLLARFAGMDEAVFTTIYNGRTDPRTFEMAGMLVKTLPVYAAAAPEKSVTDYLRELRMQLDQSKANDLYSFAEISRAYDIPGDILFAYQGSILHGLELGGQPLEVIQLKLSKVMAELSVEVFQTEDDFEVFIEYDQSRYSEAFIHSLGEAFGILARTLPTAGTLGEAELVTPAMLQTLKSLHDTDWEVPIRPAWKLLQDSADRWPERTAVIANGSSMTYGELNAAANRLGYWLQAKGVQAGDIVGLMLERGLGVYMARQGILKSGGAFLPMAPDYPDERVRYILADAAVHCLIMSRKIYEDRRDFWDQQNLCICLLDEVLMDELPAANLNVPVTPDSLAYCIYTSGSTGKPKGVMITQQNLVNFVDANPKNHEILGYTEHGGQVSLALAAITFDVSIMEEFIPLAHGLTICMANEEEIHNPLALRALCLQNQVDLMTCTPSFLMNLIDISEMEPVLARLKAIDLGAEAFPAPLYGKLRALNPAVWIMNGYGPTEATISCTMAVIEGEENITIGQPNANVHVVMVDEKNRPLPLGALGEMVILGAGVGRGYVNRDELTQKTFLRLWDMPAYKSGDLARLLPNGDIEFHGRTDNQVKLRGLRVELGEIENAMNAFPGIKTSIVVMKKNASEEFLAGYFTAGTAVDIRALQAHLAGTLTYYMVPGVLMQLEAFPLTANGKIDKKHLPEVEYAAAARSYEAPRTPTEEGLCRIFAEVLRLDRVGAADDFFALGGTSLSASKVAMMAMNAGYPVVYGDVFKYPTPRRLAMRSLDSGIGEKDASLDTEVTDYDYSSLQTVLASNVLAQVDDIRQGSLGNIVLLGATGFLGIHVLKHYLENEQGIVYCLIRHKKEMNIEQRITNLLMYYFDDACEELLGSRIRCIDGDLTDEAALHKLDDLDFQTVINCAACVKHFAHDDTLERINVQGVRNLIAMCQRLGRRLVQISTVSIAGESQGNQPPADRLLMENELYFGQILDNAYIHTKFMAERYMLEAVRDGLDGKILRVSNLMSRDVDGEFQLNFYTNAFMRRLRGYQALGCFPQSLMGAPVEFSPIDSTAEAVLLLATAPEKFTVFHPYNNHHIFMSDAIASMNRQGFTIRVVPDPEFEEILQKASENREIEDAISGLFAYREHGADIRCELESDNTFTMEALYRLGYLWPITSREYLDKSIVMLAELGFFD